MLVLDRPGTTLRALGEYAIRLDIQTGNEGSTELRRRLEDGESYHDLVSPSVARVLARS